MKTRSHQNYRLFVFLFVSTLCLIFGAKESKATIQPPPYQIVSSSLSVPSEIRGSGISGYWISRDVLPSNLYECWVLTLYPNGMATQQGRFKFSIHAHQEIGVMNDANDFFSWADNHFVTRTTPSSNQLIHFEMKSTQRLYSNWFQYGQTMLPQSSDESVYSLHYQRFRVPSNLDYRIMERKGITPNPEPNPTTGTLQKPNLYPYQLSGWEGKVVTSKTPGHHRRDTVFGATDPVYLDFSFANGGTANITGTLVFHVLINGRRYDTISWTGQLNAGSVFYWQDRRYNGLASGTHRIEVVADPYNAIQEISETDNRIATYIRIKSDPKFTVSGRGKSIRHKDRTPSYLDLTRYRSTKGYRSRSHTFRISNTGEETLSVSMRTVGRDYRFSRRPATRISPNRSSFMTVRFKPYRKGYRSGYISYRSNDPLRRNSWFKLGGRST